MGRMRRSDKAEEGEGGGTGFLQFRAFGEGIGLANLQIIQWVALRDILFHLGDMEEWVGTKHGAAEPLPQVADRRSSW